jgi:ABC-type multidrug transport system fused ATPase/permease subunit
MAMRGERGAGRRQGSEAKAAQAGVTAPVDGPPTLQALGDLLRLVGRSNAPQLKLRLVAAIGMTLAGKGLGVLAPLVLGAAVNHLAAGQGPEVAIGLGFAGFALGWAVVRLLSAIAPNASDVVFAPVRSAAQRTAATETFAHALSLSLDFHQTKRTGALSRTIDRGARSVDFLLRILVFNLAPTGWNWCWRRACWRAYDWRFAVTAVGDGGDLWRLHLRHLELAHPAPA